MRDNASGADNQQETNVLQEIVKLVGSSETTRQAPFLHKRHVIQAYLFGAMHDGWIRKSDRRYRIAQKGTEWLKVIQVLVSQAGYRSWIYREGKSRDVFVLESVAPIFREHFDPVRLQDREAICAYIRGFFDAEGGIPQNPLSTRYIQLTQKDYGKISLLKEKLSALDIASGKIHNPSKDVDPHYWRIFIARSSIMDFVSVIGSWHPRKYAIFQEWMKI